MSQDGYQNESESTQESHVIDLKKEEPIVKVASYHYPNHPVRQQSSRKGFGNQQDYYGRRWN